MTHSFLRHHSSIHACPMTHILICRGVFALLLQISTPHSLALHLTDSSIHTCDMTHILIYSYTHIRIYAYTHVLIYSYTHILICRGEGLSCVATDIIRDMTHSCTRHDSSMHTCDMTHSSMRHDSSMHTCDMTHSSMRHDSSTHTRDMTHSFMRYDSPIHTCDVTHIRICRGAFALSSRI